MYVRREGREGGKEGQERGRREGRAGDGKEGRGGEGKEAATDYTTEGYGVENGPVWAGNGPFSAMMVTIWYPLLGSTIDCWV